jgi:enamine deaminase RidA (YjgF/YER057c/UK114 family)
VRAGTAGDQEETMAAQVEFINPPGLAQFKTFSHVAKVSGGKTIHISGQVSWNEKGEVMHPGDLKAQAGQVFENLKAALAAAGATYDNVVKFTIYVVNLKPQDRTTISEVRSRYLSSARPPASTMIGVQSLVSEGLLLEVEAVAVVD